MLRPILKLSFHVHIYLPNGLCHSSLQIRTWYVFLPFPTCTTCPTHLTLLDLIIVMFYLEYQITELLVMQFPVASYHFLALVLTYYKYPFLEPSHYMLSLFVCLFSVFRGLFFLLFMEWLCPYFLFVLPCLHLSFVFSPCFNLLFVSTLSQFCEFRLAGLA